MTDGTGFTILFEMDDGGPPFYAGFAPDRALAFAPTLATAAIWPTAEIASNFLRNGYGPASQAIGTVVPVIDGDLEPAS